MRYEPDLSGLSVNEYKNHLKSIELLPSRKVLLESIEENFSAIQENGISNMQALMKAISTPAKLTAFSQKSHINLDYLKILKREIGSLAPNTVPLSEFDMLSAEAVQKLNSNGLRNSKDFFEAYPDIEKSACELADCKRLFRLCGLVRINGIGALAAKIFLEAGYASADDIASGNAKDMVEKINAVNSAKHYYDGNLGLKDMTFCITHATMLMCLSRSE